MHPYTAIFSPFQERHVTADHLHFIPVRGFPLLILRRLTGAAGTGKKPGISFPAKSNSVKNTGSAWKQELRCQLNQCFVFDIGIFHTLCEVRPLLLYILLGRKDVIFITLDSLYIRPHIKSGVRIPEPVTYFIIGKLFLENHIYSYPDYAALRVKYQKTCSKKSI